MGWGRIRELQDFARALSAPRRRRHCRRFAQAGFRIRSKRPARSGQSVSVTEVHARHILLKCRYHERSAGAGLEKKSPADIRVGKTTICRCGEKYSQDPGSASGR